MDQNLSQADSFVQQAVDDGAAIIAFPENFSCFKEDGQGRVDAAEVAERTLQWLTERASQHNLYILGGSYPVPADEQRVYNRATLVSPEGRLWHYDKIHLFDVALDRTYTESKGVKPGSSMVVAETPLGNIGLSICYDMRFPELYRAVEAQHQPDIWMIPSAFTRPTGKAHWEVLLRARAIENLAYVVAPAQCGSPYPGRVTWGHGLVVNSWGQVLTQHDETPGVKTVDVDLEELHHFRNRLPALRHRVL